MDLMPKKWKAVQSKNKIKSKTTLALKTLLLIFLILLLGFTVNIFKNLKEPLSYRGFNKEYTWQGEFKINLVFRGKNISVLSFDPEERTIKVVNIADETYLQVPGGFGSWQLRSIFDLGESSERQTGAKLLSLALSNFLAAPIDGFIEPLGELREKSGYDLAQYLRSNPLNSLSLLGNSKISLNLEEFTRLVLGIYSVRFDKISAIDLKEAKLLEQKILPDGNLGFIGDPVKIDGFAGSIFMDQKIRKEGKTVAIFNATGKPGAAQKAGLLISHLGGNVIFTANANTPDLNKSFIFTKEPMESPTYQRLSQIFAPSCLKKKCDILDDLDILNSRAEINVVLGSDFAI